jgi:release factor glutamine methyltransferase
VINHHSVEIVLRAARSCGLDRLDAQLLLAAMLRHPRSWLLSHGDHVLTSDQHARYNALVERRAAGEPLAYLLGEKEFYGINLHVSPDVLIPRPDTESLVEWALSLLPEGEPRDVADLGTGSGALALAIKTHRHAAHVSAVDISPAALNLARSNAQRLGLSIDWSEGNWWQALAGRQFDLVVSNPPYIAEGDEHLPDLQHEPRLALTSGADGLDAIRAIVLDAPCHLRAGGWLLLEHGYTQHDAVQTLMMGRGFQKVSGRFDLGGHVRCTGGQWLGISGG